MKNNIKKDVKVALIVEGGGFKSSFTAGILDTFITNNFNPFHLHVGVSGGAMNLTSYLSNQYKRNIKIIKDIAKNTNFISLVRFLKGGNYMELQYLIDITANKYPLKLNIANNQLSSSDFKVVVTNYQNGKPAYLSVKKYGWDKTLLASGSIPIATRGYCEISGKQYIDGGLVDPLPVKRVYDWGYRNIVLLRTNITKIIPDWNVESLYAPLFYRDNPKLQKLISKNDKIYEKSQQYISSAPSDLNIIQIAPKSELKCGVISYSMNNIIEDYRYGLELGLDSLQKLNRKFYK